MDDNEDIVQQLYNNQFDEMEMELLRDDGSNRILVRCLEDRYA